MNLQEVTFSFKNNTEDYIFKWQYSRSNLKKKFLVLVHTPEITTTIETNKLPSLDSCRNIITNLLK